MVAAGRSTRLVARCCASLALGALVGPYAIGHLQSPLIAVAVATVVALPPLLAILLDSAMTRRGVGMVVAAVTLALAGLALYLLIVWLVGWTRGTSDLMVTLAIFLAPVVAGFALSRATGKDGNPFKTATLAGMAAWLGIVVHFIAYANISLNRRATQVAAPTGSTSGHVGPAGLHDLGSAIVALVVLFFAMGFIYAAGAGLLGAAARRALARLLSR